MLGTDFRTGSPNWIDLGSPDVPAAAAFYQAVLGWRFVSAGPDTGGYGFFQLDGETVAALGPLTEEGASSAWMPHFLTPDVRATTEAVRAHGGQVRREPVDAMGEGWPAQFTDPQGAQFACWQPGRTLGLRRTSAENTLVWVELHVPDPVADIAFYAALFGWRSAELPAPGMTYRVLSIADGDQEDGSFGGAVPLAQGSGGAARWVPYFAVADVDATTGAVAVNGGSVLVPGEDVPEVGRIAWVADRAGAVFALLKPAPRQG
ncbi:VOC family protein [Streptomyces sp. NPDC051567]|uniref:VOC family protein n=1 Tax=Streptomyces sp. NPDC051567 TaxID=3365660 RepID=UPI00379AAEC2